MKTSDTLQKFTPAFLRAQKAITFAAKDAQNPAFRSRYADLPAVIDAIKPALNDAGIIFTQLPASCDSGSLALTTRLMHESGEFIEETCTVPLSKQDPQGFGSALTYARRYALSSICGLYADLDDDANAACGVGPSGAGNAAKSPAKGTSEPLKPAAPAAKLSDKTREALITLMEDAKAAPRLDAAMKAFKVSSIDGFTEEQAQKVYAKIGTEIATGAIK